MRLQRRWWFGVLIGLVCGGTTVFAQSDAEVVAAINRHLRTTWDANRVQPSPFADNGEFARRTALDIVGRIPSLEELLPLLANEKRDSKGAVVDVDFSLRSQFVDQLLDHAEYSQHWSNVWGNLLVGRANRRNQGARDDLERWLNGAFTRNLRYDQFASELISATGNSDQNGAVGFLANHLNENAVPATAITARLFLGLQVQCTQCHNHPFNEWKQNQFWSLNAFFRGTRRQNSGGQNAFVLTDEPGDGIVFFERRNGVMEAAIRQFVDGTQPLSESLPPRQQFAQLVTAPDQPYLARALINRMWGHFLGVGITKPVDDMGPHNPPSHPELLDELAGHFRASGYDLKRLIRWITASDAYQRTSRATSENTADEPLAGATPLFTRPQVKPFTSEQLYDSLLIATAAHQAGRNFRDAEAKRNEWLQQFVQTFGTDENDESTSFNGTVPQALVLMNGELVRNALGGGKGSFLRAVVDGDVPTLKALKKDVGKVPSLKSIPGRIEVLYLTALSRRPTPSELRALEAAYHRNGGRDPIAGLQDIFWAVVNSNEFILNH